MSNAKQERNRRLGEGVVAALRARHFGAQYCETAADAVREATRLIPAGASVTFGGSVTIRETGLVAALKAGDYQVFDRDEIPPAERGDFVREHYFSDVYLSSVNALTEDGVIYNMDGMGNRVASLIYGPKQVVLLVGINKIARDEAAAIARVRGTAAPTNAQRFDISTPCRKSGRCADCKSPDTICCTLTAMRACRPAGRIHVILFGEEYGF
jgi:hypothetical protein